MSAAASFSSALQASGGLIGLIGAFFDAPDRRPRAACSKGLYPIQIFPHVLGSEAAGEIVALPTDPAVLADEEYKKRGFAVGGKVAVVRRRQFDACTIRRRG